MRDKQIIIDGVDVSECSHHEGKLCSMSREAYCYCSDKPNCIYKRFKRKEQECEDLKTDYNKAIQKFIRIEEYCKDQNLKCDYTACGVLHIINEDDL